MSHRLRNPLKMLRSNKIALDFGSGRTRLAASGGEILLDEPTIIALEQGTGAVLAVGAEAKSFLGKTPERIQVVRPVENGVILEFDAAKQLLHHYLFSVLPDDGSRIRATVTVPQGATDLERRTLVECCKAAGLGHCDLIGAPLAAAAGAGLDIRAAKGLLLLGVGFGLAEASLISLSDVVQSESNLFGGHSFQEAVARQIAGGHRIAIGENMAERIVFGLAWASPPETQLAMTVTGKDVVHGTPASLDLTDADFAHALDTPLSELEALVRRVMEKSPAELVADIAETGLHLYGDGARLTGLERFLGERLELPVRLVDEPGFAAVRGAAATLRPDSDYRRLVRR